ncbi:MAG TPA: Holliday junction resolvase-like protein [Candidatus Thermoplasmatota archaeon]|nr:Holliday junction resolvase-like protein [Candidatus Thermoplasmatota archaeon]
MDLALLAAALAGSLVLALLLWAWSTAALLRRLRALRSAKQSQSTRYGQISEQFAPHLAAWPWDPKGFRFIGSPVDGVQFTEEGVVFVEIKSADGRLTPQQALVKRHVEAGRVGWREVRLR